MQLFVFAVLAIAARARPLIDQQVTWFYANDLDKGSAFLRNVVGLNLTLDQGPCRIYQAAPAHFLGVCNSRAAPTVVPPVTYTIVVTSRSAVNQWHAFLSGQGDAVAVTDPSYSETFKVYAFNFYDPDKENSLGYYRFEVQTFESQWPQPQCEPIAALRSSGV